MRLTREVPVKGRYDILVAGGGVAGVAAAVSAARLGRKVLLMEKSLKLGGLATLGLVNFFVPMCNGRGKQIIFGMAEEFLRLALKYGYGDVPKDYVNGKIPEEKLEAYRQAGKKPPRYMTRFSPELFALALTELCSQSGVELMFDTLLTDTVADPDHPGRLLAVVAENKSGCACYEADYFVDATGDGDLMARTGIPTRLRKNFHTYMGLLTDLERCRRAVEKQDIEQAVDWKHGGPANLYGGFHPAEVPMYDGTDSADVNRYVVDNQLELLDKLRDQPRKSRDLVILPGMPQFRTTRCMDADYVLQETDTFRHFPDSVGAICDFDRRDYLYEIPYRTLIRKDWDNVITAGRCAAGEGYAWDVLRVIPPAILSGQAAGAACVQALETGCAIWAVDLPRLQKTLEGQNVTIHFDDADIPDKVEDVTEYND